MSISERIFNTVENWQLAWKDRLRGWFTHVITNGVERVFDFFEPDLRSEIKPSLQRLRDIEGLPDDLKAILDKAIEEPKAVQLAFLLPMVIGLLLGAGMGMASPVMRIGGYQVDKRVHSYRIPPEAMIPLFRRFKEVYQEHKDDLSDLGLTEDRWNALLQASLYYPSPAELIHWTAREVFEPEMISKYGLTAGIGRLRRDDFYKAGMDDEQIDNHWIAHWEHASWMQLIEMLHRKIITEQDVKDWFPLVEMAPYWAENLIEIAYTWPTRVDVRRWWDMRTIDEARLRELYEGMGYRGKNLDDYILWTKVYVAFPDLMARFTKGWLTEDNVKSELVALGMPPERVEEIIQTKVKKEAPERVTKERDLTKTDIYRGVKKGVISEREGIELLVDLGYSEEEAEYIIAINIAAVEGSPESYTEFKQMTQMYRKAVGLEAKIPPSELAEAEKALIEAEAELKTKIAEGVKEEKLLPYQKAKDDAAYRYRQLLAKWRE